MTLKVGDKAPDFKLVDTDKQEVSLSDYRGKNVVLLFFPQAFTGTCTKELCAVRDDLKDYQGVNGEVLAISVDSIFTLKKFKEDQGYTFRMLSDFNKEVSRAYGSIYEDWIHGMKGVSKRSVFVIDKDGIIRHTQVLEVAGDMPDLDAAKQAIASLN